MRVHTEGINFDSLNLGTVSENNKSQLKALKVKIINQTG